jgi:pyruvate dehydrogenase (quinone)
MLMGDLLTVVQEKLPIKIVVYHNNSLGFVELEQKAEGLLDAYTDLKNPDFGRVAEAIGLWGRHVDKADDLEAAVKDWLSVPGPALLDVAVNRFELVMPAKIELEQFFGMALYSVKGVLAGRGGDVFELVKGAVMDL